MVYLLNCTIVYCNTKVSNYFGMFEKYNKFIFSTISSSLFDFNQVDISVLILFSMFMGILRFPKVSSVDII